MRAKFRRIMTAALAFGLLGGAALAQSHSVDQARKALFNAKGSQVVFPQAGLSAADAELLKLLFKLSARDLDNRTLAAAGLSGEQAKSALAALQQFRGALYYGAMAASPAEGLISGATQMIQNMHSAEAARGAALAQCQAQGGSGCRVVAEVLPKGFEPRSFSLSQTATKDFAGFRKGAKPKALAVSPGTGAYAIVRGLGARAASVRECNAKSGRSDCALALYDE